MGGVVGGFAVLLEINRAEEFDGFGETVLEGDLGFPSEMFFGEGDVGAALAGIIFWPWHVGDFGFAVGHFDY